MLPADLSFTTSVLLGQLSSATLVEFKVWTWGVVCTNRGAGGTHHQLCLLRAAIYLGINSNICSGWRYLHAAFGGCNLLDLGTESVIACVNMFLQHLGNPTQLRHLLRASMEYLQLEVGCQGCPLHEQPSDHDWQVWERFWALYCLPGTLPCSLGKWLNTSPACMEVVL